MKNYYIIEYFNEFENAENDGIGAVVDMCLKSPYTQKTIIECSETYEDAVGAIAKKQSIIYTTKGQYYTTGATLYTLEHEEKIIQVAEIVDARLTD